MPYEIEMQARQIAKELGGKLVAWNAAGLITIKMPSGVYVTHQI